jgi:signal transduction histidine kinase
MNMTTWAWAVAAFAALTAVVATISCLRMRRAWQVDRADLRRLQRTAQRNADQISVVSHEIRTPLALMKGAADLLAEGTPGPLTPSQARFVETISKNCHTVIDLAQDLLVQARIDAGMFTLHLQRVDFRSLATSVVKELRLLHTADIALDCPGAPPRTWADAKLMRQAITNLINNAMAHASDARLITLRVVGTAEQVLVSVSDNGSGMSGEQRQQLFERFSSGRPLRDGTGLGLVITRQIVRMHGGEVYVDTTPGRGTTMMFSVPGALERRDAVAAEVSG